MFGSAAWEQKGPKGGNMIQWAMQLCAPGYADVESSMLQGLDMHRKERRKAREIA